MHEALGSSPRTFKTRTQLPDAMSIGSRYLSKLSPDGRGRAYQWTCGRGGGGREPPCLTLFANSEMAKQSQYAGRYGGTNIRTMAV